MSVISSCPECARPITVPAGASPSAVVRCPICQGEYPLQMALENLPPMLVLVSDAAQQEAISEMSQLPPAAGGGFEFDSQLRDTAFRMPATEAPDVDFDLEEPLTNSPHDHGIKRVADIDLQSGLDLSEGAFGGKKDELLGDAEEIELDDIEFEKEPVDFGKGDFDKDDAGLEKTVDFDAEGVDFGDDSDDFEKHAVKFGDEKAEADDEFSFDDDTSDAAPTFEDEEELAPAFAETPAQDPHAADAIVPEKRKKRREPSALANLIGVVGGGAIGLSLGYFILLKFGGPNYDVAGIGKSLPRWMVSSKFYEPKTSATVVDAPGAPPVKPQLAKKMDDPKSEFNLNVPKLDEGAAPASATSTEKEADPSSVPADLDLGNDTVGIAPLNPNKGKVVPKTPDDDAMPGDDEAPADDEMPADDTTNVAADDTAAEPSDDAADVAKTDDAADDQEMTTEPAETVADDSTADDVASDDATPVVGADVPAPPETAGVRDPRTYSLIDLGSASKEVRDLAKNLSADDLSKEEFNKLRTPYFKKFCHMAQIVTFAIDDAKEPRLANHREAIEQMVLEATNNKKVSEIFNAAGKWINLDPTKRGEQGIVMTGTVESAAPEGKLFAVVVAVSGAKITVISDTAPVVKPQDRVVVLGSIMDDPASNLVGYAGSEPKVVWNGMTVKLSPAE